MILPSARESPPSPSPQPGAGPQAGPGRRRRPTRLTGSPRLAHWHSLTRSAAPPRRSRRLRRAAAQAEWPAVHRTLRTRRYASSCRSLGRNRGPGPGLKLEANSWRALRKCELRAEECRWTPQGRGPVLRTSESATTVAPLIAVPLGCLYKLLILAIAELALPLQAAPALRRNTTGTCRRDASAAQIVPPGEAAGLPHLLLVLVALRISSSTHMWRMYGRQSSATRAGPRLSVERCSRSPTSRIWDS